MLYQRYTAVRAGEVRRLAEHIRGPSRYYFRGSTRDYERRLKTDQQQGLVSLEDMLEIALILEEEAILEERC